MSGIIFDQLRVADPNTYLMSDFGDIDCDNKPTMSFNLDKTSDSFGKIIIYSSIKSPILPGTVCHAKRTNTWWICKEDYVEEVYFGTEYKHTITLEGAFEFLRRFTMTNCAFSSGRYTFGSMFGKLFLKQISGLNMQIVVSEEFLSGSLKIENSFIFNNYTLKSAIQEIADSCDLCPVASFVYSNDTTAIYMSLSFVPKTGKPYPAYPKLPLSDLEVKYEKRKMSSDSYAELITANISNSVSSKFVRYPKTGAVYLSYQDYKLSRTESYLKLPEKSYQVEKVEIFPPLVFGYFNPNDGSIIQRSLIYITDRDSSMALIKREILKNVFSIYSSDSDIDEFAKRCFDYFYGYCDSSGYHYNSNEPLFITNSSASNNFKLFNSKSKNSESYEDRTVIWESLSDKITNFHFQLDYKDGEVQSNWVKATINVQFQEGIDKSITFYVRSMKEHEDTFTIVKTSDWMRFACSYRPISDIIIDNYSSTSTKNPVAKFYNLNGRMNDPFKSGKLVSSYANEQLGDSLTRQMTYSSFSSIPKIGTLFYDDESGTNKIYVLQNTSIEIDDDDLYSVLFSLSPENIKKSPLISANQSIADFKTPQENNIRRFLRMSDIMWLSYSPETSNTFCLVDLINRMPISTRAFSFDVQSIILSRHDSSNYYYCCSGVEIPFSKGFCYQIDLPDNNIIGYSKTSTGKTINWTNWITGGDSFRYNIPISYTDDYGECDYIQFIVCNSVDVINIINSPSYMCITYDSSGNQTIDTYPNVLGGDISSQDPLFPTPYSTPNAVSDLETASVIKNNFGMGSQSPIFISKDGLEIPSLTYRIQAKDKNGIKFGNSFFDQSFAYGSYAVYWICLEKTSEILETNRTYEDSDDAHTNDDQAVVNHSWYTRSSGGGCVCSISGSHYVISKGMVIYYGQGLQSISKTPFEIGKNYEIYEIAVFSDDAGLVSRSSRRFAFSINNCQFSGNDLSLYINNNSKMLV